MSHSRFRGVIDIGNSGLKAAIWDCDQSIFLTTVKSLFWKHATDTSKQPPAEFLRTRNDGIESWVATDDVHPVETLIESLMGQLHRPVEGSIDWFISSVQPTAEATVSKILGSAPSTGIYKKIGYQNVPIKIDVRSPDKVGIDRILAAFGALASVQNKGPCMVIQAGTAVTMDLIDADGIFCGGAIMPGISLTLKYLALGTAHLPWLAPPTDPSQTILPGKDTNEAILTGVSAAFLGGIQFLVDRYRSDLAIDHPTVPVVLSGGDGLRLGGLIESPVITIDHLVLTALGRLPYNNN